MTIAQSLVFVASASGGEPNLLMEALRRRHPCLTLTPAAFAEQRAPVPLGVVVDADLGDARVIEDLKRGVHRLDRSASFVVVVVDPYGPIDIKIAMTLQADRVVPRIAVNEAMAHQSPEHRAVIEVARADFVRNGLEAVDWLAVKFSQPKTLAIALNAGETALDGIFQLAKTKTPLPPDLLRSTSETVLASVAEHGLQQWLDAVRQHHSGTYRHSLAVAGIAGTFARLLGLSRRDGERMSLAALLHDIGKAEVPVDILEKVGELTSAEEAILRRHPARGRAMVEALPEVDEEILDTISDHHECLDGSGYPRGLRGDEIGDMTRLMTICDRFANLIGRRAPAPMRSNAEAFAALSSMGGELDMPLVKAFRAVIAKLDSEQPQMPLSA